jgi:hypothetical protein
MRARSERPAWLSLISTFAASELQVVGLAEALELTLLLADRNPGRYERAALRWRARFVREVPRF